MNTGLAIICYQIVYNKWCVMGVKHAIFIVMMVHMLPLIIMSGRWQICKQERRDTSCDMLWLRTSVLQVFPHHECATVSNIHNNNDNFVLYFSVYSYCSQRIPAHSPRTSVSLCACGFTWKDEAVLTWC